MSDFTNRMIRLKTVNRLVSLPGDHTGLPGGGIQMSANEKTKIGAAQSRALVQPNLQLLMTKFVDGTMLRERNYAGFQVAVKKAYYAPENRRKILVVLDSHQNGAKELFFAGQEHPPNGPWAPVMKFNWDPGRGAFVQVA